MLLALLLTHLIWNKIVPHKMELKSILKPVNIPPYMEHKRTTLYGTFLIHILWNYLETHKMELSIFLFSSTIKALDFFSF